MQNSTNDPTRLEYTKTDKSLKSERAQTDVVLDEASGHGKNDPNYVY